MSVCYGLWNPPTASLPNCISAPRVASWRKTQRFNLIQGHVRSFLLVSLNWQPGRASSLRRRGRCEKNISNTIRRLLRDLLPLVFLHRKKVKKTHCFIQFSLRTMIWVTIAILDAMNDIQWWNFSQSRKKIIYCPKLNSGKAALSCKYGG